MAGISSHTIPFAPLSMAASMKLCPSLSVPRTATKSEPGVTLRESNTIALKSVTFICGEVILVNILFTNHAKIVIFL